MACRTQFRSARFGAGAGRQPSARPVRPWCHPHPGGRGHHRRRRLSVLARSAAHGVHEHDRPLGRRRSARVLRGHLARAHRQHPQPDQPDQGGARCPPAHRGVLRRAHGYRLRHSRLRRLRRHLGQRLSLLRLRRGPEPTAGRRPLQHSAARRRCRCRPDGPAPRQHLSGQYRRHNRPGHDHQPAAQPRERAVLGRILPRRPLPRGLRLDRRMRRLGLHAQLHLHRGRVETPGILPQRHGRGQLPGNSGHARGRTGHHRTHHPVLRTH